MFVWGLGRIGVFVFIKEKSELLTKTNFNKLKKECFDEYKERQEEVSNE